MENSGNPSDGEVNDFLNRAIDAQGLEFFKAKQGGFLFKTFKDNKLKQEVSWTLLMLASIFWNYFYTEFILTWPSLEAF